MHKLLSKCLQVPRSVAPHTVKLCTSTVRTKLDEIRETIKPHEAKNYGQPTPETHSHLLKPGEFTPGITLQEFQARRTKLVEKIVTNSNARQHYVLIPSGKKKFMSGKIPYVFRQNTDFFYLTGCQEPDSCLLLEINDEKCVSTMFLRPKDKNMEMWDGVVTGLGDGPEFFGVDQSIDIADLTNYLGLTFKSSQPEVIWYNSDESEFPRLTSTVKELIQATAGANLTSPTNLIHQLRLFKSPSEQKLMQRTCQIAAEAINETISWCRPDISEHHLYAKVDYECRMRDANFLAYPPVVATGANATTIHYINNCQMARAGETVLMDAGCEFGGYSSDITRTFPVDGKFTEAQRVLYEVVLQTQTNLIRVLQEKECSLDELFEIMCLELGKCLKEIGLIPKHVSGVELARAAYKFCPHHVSHYLGMDVHDTSTISRGLKLEPGMCFTIEPGLYISRNSRTVPEEFRGIGIRIEDDALMLPNRKLQILTETCVKDVKDVER
ncbi:xaa-Pro aminopeptidase 3 [Culicoides brevitarsis]|uniref:xaa-Pro aminopeptidase 3 n=1 Tax=Culicoides brevitarsis TaxID=469753 RepID=UPI00307B7033